MKHLFYAISIMPILWEMAGITEPKRVQSFLERLRNKKNEKPIVYTSTEKRFLQMQFLYFVWGFIGLFTNQWPLFLVLFLISLIPKRNIVLKWLDALYSFLLIVFILLNEYHLHINFFQTVTID